jgi:hypothetical protein
MDWLEIWAAGPRVSVPVLETRVPGGGGSGGPGGITRGWLGGTVAAVPSSSVPDEVWVDAPGIGWEESDGKGLLPLTAENRFAQRHPDRKRPRITTRLRVLKTGLRNMASPRVTSLNYFVIVSLPSRPPRLHVRIYTFLKTVIGDYLTVYSGSQERGGVIMKARGDTVIKLTKEPDRGGADDFDAEQSNHSIVTTNKM